MSRPSRERCRDGLFDPITLEIPGDNPAVGPNEEDRGQGSHAKGGRDRVRIVATAQVALVSRQVMTGDAPLHRLACEIFIPRFHTDRMLGNEGPDP